MNTDFISHFFVNLSKRLYNENNLSDITWSLCETNADFKRLFIEFFFGTMIKEAPDIVIEREYTSRKSRVDFWFEHTQDEIKTEYIVEVKIYDGNDHHSQYLNHFPNARFGWIANYRIVNENDNIIVKTWKEFYDYLQEYLRTSTNAATDTLINGYCNYIKSVCSIINMKKITLDKVSSLFYFNTIVNEFVNSTHDGIQCKKYPSTASIGVSWHGSYFTLKRVGSRKSNDYYPWFGVCYDETGQWIGVEFSKENGGIIYNYFTSKNNIKDGEYFKKPELNKDNELWFKLKDEHFKLFNEEQSVEKQKILLSAFFKEVIGKFSEFVR